MVVVVGNNEYVISKVDDSTNLLTLGRKYYLWRVGDDGQAELERVKKPTAYLSRIEKGNYWLFDVVTHTNFTPGVHLSMVSEAGQWKAYLVSDQFPLKVGESCLLAPTHERIARPQKRLLKVSFAE